MKAPRGPRTSMEARAERDLETEYTLLDELEVVDGI